MKTRQFAIVALIAALAVPVAVVEANNDDPACVKQAGNSSLEVSAEKVELLREHGWKATDETGRLVCE